MAQCNCETYFDRWYYKYTHFWDPDNDANKDVYAAIQDDFATWVRTEEQILRSREYDRSETTVYNCGSTGKGCACLYIRKRWYENFTSSINGLNANPGGVPFDFNGSISSAYNVNGTCNCTLIDTGAPYTESPEAGQQPYIEILRSEFFAVRPIYKLRATEITAQGCQGNVPQHLAYNELPFQVNREAPATSEFPLKYNLKRQRTKWIRYYTNTHTCP